MPAAAEGEDGIAEPSPQAAHLAVVLQTRFFEGGEGVRAEHFRPLVTVVSRGVSAREDMGERTEEPVFFQRRQDQRLPVDPALHVQDRLRSRGIEVLVQLHVEQAEVHLPEGIASFPEGPGAEQAVDGFIGEGFAGLVVPGQAFERRPVVTPVLHELAGDLHRVPFHVGYPGRHAEVDGGQHVLEGVAELVKEGFHLPERHEGRFATDGLALVADHVGHGQPGGPSGGSHDRAPAHERIHPRAALLLRRTAVRVQVEARHGFVPVVVYPEELHVFVPRRRLAGSLLQAHFEQPFRELEQAVQHARQREIGPELFVLQVVARLAKPFRPVRDVPVLQLVVPPDARQRLQRLHVPLGGAAARRAQFVEQGPHGPRVGRHFPAEAQLRESTEAEQPALVVPKGDDLRGHFPVVPLAVRRLGDEGAVHFLPQVAARAVLHEGHETRIVQREDPGPVRGGGLFVSLLPGRIGRQLEERVRQPVDFFGLRQRELAGLGGVEDVVGELRAQFREPLADLVVPFPPRVVESHPVQLGFADGRLQNALLGRFEALGLVAVPQAAEGLVQGFALAEPVAELDHFREQGIVDLPQFGRVLHPVQVGHDAPGAAQVVFDSFERVHERVPGARRRLLEAGQGLFAAFEHGPDTRFDMLYFDLVVGGQIVPVQQWIAMHFDGLAFLVRTFIFGYDPRRNQGARPVANYVLPRLKSTSHFPPDPT